jgi:hypothetical protein
VNVFTYYESCHPGAPRPKTMDVWEESWKRYGWTPIVLGEWDFLRHPAALFYDAATSKLPTFNNPIYERACYRRWLAMATLHGGLMTDYDTVNRGFTPENLSALNLTDLTILCEHRVPCVVFGTPAQYERAALEFARYVPGPRDVFRGNPKDNCKANDGKPLVEDMTILQNHTSDMHICGQANPHPWFVEKPICCDISDIAGHEGTSLIHCSSCGCHGKDRVAVMRSLAT